MGFVEHNSFGKFEAEVNLPMPSFSAESLLSLPTKQFGAATIDSNSITNYDPDNFSRFHVGEGGTGAGAHTTNVDGSIRTRHDKGFHLMLDAGADILSQVVTLSHDGQEDFSFTLKPGDRLKRVGMNKDVIYVPADGSEDVTTEVPWIRGGHYNISLEEVSPITPADETNGDSTCATENRAANTDGTCGDCLSGFIEDDTGTCVVDAAEAEEETNWLLYGGAFALLAVGGVMAMKMMKKKSKK